MAGFDYSNPTHRKIRRYRTLAIKAALYAQRPAYASVRSSWVYLAQSWTDLADIKERANRWDAARATPPPGIHLRPSQLPKSRLRVDTISGCSWFGGVNLLFTGLTTLLPCSLIVPLDSSARGPIG